MDAGTLLALSVYAAPIGLALAWFFWRRHRLESRTHENLEIARSTGLDVPP